MATAAATFRGKIGVLIEEHFDPAQFHQFNEFFPAQGYEVEYISHLWGHAQLTFAANPDDCGIKAAVTVTTEIDDVQPSDYQAIVCIGAYAMDRLRYQPTVKKGRPNQAPAVQFLRRALQIEGLPVGTICHGLWLFCADPTLLKGRKVTCAHTMVCDVENAGAEIVYSGDRTADLVVDDNLVSAKQTAVTDRFMETLVMMIEERQQRPNGTRQAGILPSAARR